MVVDVSELLETCTIRGTPLQIGKRSFGYWHDLKNNFDYYLFAIKNLLNIVNIYFYETTFQDESTYIDFIFLDSTQKNSFIVKV